MLPTKWKCWATFAQFAMQQQLMLKTAEIYFQTLIDEIYIQIFIDRIYIQTLVDEIYIQTRIDETYTKTPIDEICIQILIDDHFSDIMYIWYSLP